MLTTHAMCGRFTQTFTYAELHEFWSAFSAEGARATLGNLQPRYHICPTDPIVAVLQTKTGLTLERVRWGLAPFWWKQPLKKLPATFNARAETVATKPMFREAFKQRRCIIPASGYYEWQARSGRTGRDRALRHHGHHRAEHIRREGA